MRSEDPSKLFKMDINILVRPVSTETYDMPSVTVGSRFPKSRTIAEE